MTRPFQPAELSGADDGERTTAELGEALATARTIEAQLGAGDVHPSASFVDRVMTAVVAEPRPQPAIAAGLALRRGRIGAMLAALGDSWKVAFSGGRPFAVRAQAAAFVLVAILAVGSLGGIAAVGAARLLSPAETPPGPPSPSQLVVPTATPTPGSDRRSPADGNRRNRPTRPNRATRLSRPRRPSRARRRRHDRTRPANQPRPLSPARPRTPAAGDGGGGGGGGRRWRSRRKRRWRTTAEPNPNRR